MTTFEDVREVPPSTVLVVRADGGGETFHQYWEILAPNDEAKSRDTAGRVDELRERLRDAVTRHLVSDVPLGVFLSGGGDSGAIVAMMREAGHPRIRTFSITFSEAEFDEGAEAARIAARDATEHSAWEVRAGDRAADLDRIVAAMDQPTIDGVNTYYVFRATRNSGTIVALSGLGGDEVFCGYPSFRQAARLLALQRIAARLGPARPVLTVALALAAVPLRRSAKLREGLAQAPTIRSAYLAIRGC